VGFSLINVIVKITHVPAIAFAFYRLWLGSFAMLVALRVARRRVTWAKVRPAIPAGVLFGLNIALFFSALKRTSVADVLVISALQPALTLLVAGPLFGERITRSDAAWTAASLGGVVLVTVGSSGTPVWSLRGDLLAVGSLLAWTIYFLVSKRVRTEVPALEYMAGVTVTAALVMTPVALLTRQPLGSLRLTDWLWLLLFVAGAQGGHVMLAWAHAEVDVSVSSLLILAQPIISSVAALLVLGESITGLEIAGGVVVVISMAAVVRQATRARGGEAVPTAEAAPS
jgi:drug/metabolite transporter (DMT)-like permease